jgi:hypothetical protein
LSGIVLVYYTTKLCFHVSFSFPLANRFRLLYLEGKRKLKKKKERKKRKKKQAVLVEEL